MTAAFLGFSGAAACPLAVEGVGEADAVAFGHRDVGVAKGPVYEGGGDVGSMSLSKPLGCRLLLMARLACS